MPDDEAQEKRGPVYELYGLTWQRRAELSAGDWLRAGDACPIWEQVDIILDLFVDPPREAFLAETPAERLGERLGQLWLLAGTAGETEKNG